MVTPLKTFVPRYFFELRDDQVPDEVQFQRRWNNKCLRQKREQHHAREDRWGIKDHRAPRLPNIHGPTGPPEGVWKRSTTVGGGAPAAADPDEEADDENNGPMVQASSSAPEESSATASVGEAPTMRVREEPQQRPANITDSKIVEAGISGDPDLDTIPEEYTRIEMIQSTASLGNTPEGTGSISHLGSNLATEGDWQR